MAIVKKVPRGWIVVSANSGLPVIDRVFHSLLAAKNYAARLNPGMY